MNTWLNYLEQGMERRQLIFMEEKMAEVGKKESSNEKRTCFHSSMSTNGQEAQRQWHGHARDSGGYSLDGGQEPLIPEAQECANKQS